MRSARFLAVLLVPLCVASLSPRAWGQDFDPRGHNKKRPGSVTPGRPGPVRPGPVTSGHVNPDPVRPGPANPAAGAPSGVLIERYTRIVLSQPGSPFPLQRLAQLYRDRDGKTEALVKDFEGRAAATGADQYAATVALAGLYKIDGRTDDAAKTFEKAIALKPQDASAILALARLLQDRADLAGARARYEQAYSLQTASIEKQQTLRTLMTVTLDSKDWDAAKSFHDKLVAIDRTSLFTKGELGRELFARGEFARAESEFRALVAAAAGDNRALAPALKELGHAQAKAGENEQALITLKRALSVAGSEAAVRTELYEIIAEVYRKEQKLPELTKLLEDEHAADFARLVLLGSLYEETGDAAKALATYKRALAQNPKHLDLRLKTVRLLQSQGEIDKAITEYEALVRAAPGNPTFVFELCDALLQRGDRARALTVLTEVEGRVQTDEDALSRIADFYGRIGESDKSVRVLQRLSTLSGGDPGHITDLGDRYFQDGNMPMALQTWRRILTAVTPRAKALATLGDVYLEHELQGDALTSYREAVALEPQNLAFKRQLAAGLERARTTGEARALWQEIMQKAGETGDRALVREARTRIVVLWALDKELASQVTPLAAKFRGPPPDLDAGRMLAESYSYLRRYPEAESTWRAVIAAAPGDVDAYLALERTLNQQAATNPDKLRDAIAVLEKLVEVDPKRARELYQRMADYSLTLYRDDDAIRFSAKAVELNPDDAEGHRHLGDRYRSRQLNDKAIAEYRAAIARNDRLFLVYFQLAEMLLARGESDEADRLLRKVIRIAPDDELVARAARAAMQIHVGRGTLAALEQDLLPLAIGNPQRPLFRKLLVEIYGTMTFALVRRSRSAGPDAQAARNELSGIGARAIKPLLDALSDADVGQQRTAIDVLAYVQNKNAALPLFAYANGAGEGSLRTRAMLASGALRDPQMVSRYEALLLPKDGVDVSFDQTASAAAWSIARAGGPKAPAVLRRLLTSNAPDLRAIAALGVAELHDTSAASALGATLRAADAATQAKASAAYALGVLGAEQEFPRLLQIARTGEPLSRRLALAAIARLPAMRGAQVVPVAGSPALTGAAALRAPALDAMCDALFYASDNTVRGRREAELVRKTALTALSDISSGAIPPKDEDLMPLPDGVLDIGALLSGVADRESSKAAAAATFVAFAPRIAAAARRALAMSPEGGVVVLDGLLATADLFAPFVDQTAPPQAQALAKVMAQGFEVDVLPLTKSGDATVRSRALSYLSKHETPLAEDALARAATDRDENVQRMALSSMASAAPGTRLPKSVQAAVKVATTHTDWSLRMLAVAALARLGDGTREASISGPLVTIAGHDKFALVREAALSALAAVDNARAVTLAKELAQSETEPRVRIAAAALANGVAPSSKIP